MGWWRFVWRSVLRLDLVGKRPFGGASPSGRELKYIDLRAVVAKFEGIQSVWFSHLPEDSPNFSSRRRQDVGCSSGPSFGGERESETVIPEECNPYRIHIDASVAKCHPRHVAAECKVELRHAVTLGTCASRLPNGAAVTAYRSGRYWDRTSDLCSVNAALIPLS